MELSDLNPVLSAEGPFVTVHVPAESEVEQAADKYDLTWKSALQALAEQGVDERTRDALREARGDHSEGGSRFVVASAKDAKVLVAVSLPTPPRQQLTAVGPLPRLLPLVDDVATRVPHVVIIADRTGADVQAFYDAGKVAEEVTVKGRAFHIRKLPVGGWSQLRYLHRAENGWKAAAAEIVASVVELAGTVDADLLVLGGDERELGYVREKLPESLKSKVVEIPAGRALDGDEPLIPRRISDALDRHLADQTLELLADYAQERGQVKRAAEGVEDVVHALRKAQVETLLVTTEVNEDKQLWFGEEPVQIGLTRDEVVELGAQRPQQGPLVDVLLRTALATGAGVQLVPHQPKEAPFTGVGALLRYADES